MKHSIEFKHFEPKERVRKLVEELIARLQENMSTTFPGQRSDAWSAIERRRPRGPPYYP